MMGSTDSDPAAAGSNCDPANARGAVPMFSKALLDMIAAAEGTNGRGKDGYDVTFAYSFYAENCDDHPFRDRAPTCKGKYCSTAAGRYQFLLATWDSLDLPDFWPENQERGALELVSRRGVSLPPDRALSESEFADAMDKLSYEWSSLPPGRYGQPTYTLEEARAKYCEFTPCSLDLIARP
ncbi:MAG TPA: glycoside hydrolase family 104 protein [Polyangiaceae bacterium]|nr:glycoside hydrolase family 104 protein [Polyangiaceae bacterium]